MQAADTKAKELTLHCIESCFSKDGTPEQMVRFDQLRDALATATAVNIIATPKSDLANDAHLEHLTAALKDNKSVKSLTINLDSRSRPQDQMSLYFTIADNPFIEHFAMVVKAAAGLEAMQLKSALNSSKTRKSISLELVGGFRPENLVLLEGWAKAPSANLEFSSFVVNGAQKLEIAAKLADAGDVFASAAASAVVAAPSVVEPRARGAAFGNDTESGIDGSDDDAITVIAQPPSAAASGATTSGAVAKPPVPTLSL